MGKKSAEYVGNPRSDLRASFLLPSVPVAGAGAVGVVACDDELDLHGKNRKIDAANLDQ